MNASELLRLMAAVSFGTLIVLSIVFLAGRTAAMTETGKWARAYDKQGLFDEQGVYGFADCSVGFATPDDEAQYLGWCIDNGLL